MARIYARVDVDGGVHKAPANVVERRISEFAQDPTKREQDMLNPLSINVDGEIHSLEVNPQGQFLFIEILTGLPISRTLAGELARGPAPPTAVDA